MITTTNYNEKIKEINFSSLPAKFLKGHEFVQKATESGSNWDAYTKSENIKKMIDIYLVSLNEYLAQNSTEKVAKTSHEKTSAPEKKTDTTPTEKKHTTHKHKETPVQEEKDDFDLVERIPDEIRFIKRYLALHNKKKSKDDLLRFINALHRAIIEKKVRKTSPYSKQVAYIQDKLVKTYNEMTKALTMQISDKTINEFKTIIASEKIMPSVRLIKRYINLNGKFGVKDKAKQLMDAMQRAAKLKKIAKNDKYAKLLDAMFLNLNNYVKNKSQKILSIQQTELNGLNGVLSGCGCHAIHGDEEINGLDGTEDFEETTESVNEIPGVMNSMDFRNMQFKTLGFVGKYRKLIGDPSKGFSAMVYGKPKMGKSFLCVDFAGYLARNHGKVLYIANEEGLDMTLQEKLKAKDVAHPNLFVAEEIPNDLSPYDFIFIDSVNKLGLSSHDLQSLKSSYPEKSFIFVFQTTKEGNFRGANEFQHDVDIIIEVPQKGVAVQNGRFNQGGEMRIFEEQEHRN